MGVEASFDEIFASVGDKGRYQKLLLLGFTLPLAILLSWAPLTPIFLSSVPDHWCHVEGKPDDVSLQQWKNRTIPWIKDDDGEGFSKCQQYKVIGDTSQLQDENQAGAVAACEDGWDYDQTWYVETLSTKNDWVCEDGHRRTQWLSIGLFGKLIGVLFSTRLSDIIGRKKVIFFLLSTYAVFSLLRLVASGGWTYPIMILSMVPFPSLLQISLVFVTEQVNNSWRPLVNSIFFFFWMVGMCILSLLAWLTRSWVWLTVATSVPAFLLLLILLTFQESSRWLASRGRTTSTANSLRRIAKMNGVEPPVDLEAKLQSYIDKKQTEEKQSLLDFLKVKSLAKLFLIMSGCWTCNLLVYYTLSYNVTNLGGNQFVNFFLLGVVEGPSTLMAWIACQTIGRRFSQVFFFALLILSTVCPIFFASTHGVETVVTAVISKILNNASFYAFYLQMIEIYPTSHRTSIMGMSNTIVLVANMSSPYIAYSSVYWSRLPYVVMTALCTIGCVLALFIPETIDHSLPQTISDSEEYYANQPFWSYKGRRPRDWPSHLAPGWFSRKEYKTHE